MAPAPKSKWNQLDLIQSHQLDSIGSFANQAEQGRSRPAAGHEHEPSSGVPSAVPGRFHRRLQPVGVIERVLPDVPESARLRRPAVGHYVRLVVAFQPGAELPQSVQQYRIRFVLVGGAAPPRVARPPAPAS